MSDNRGMLYSYLLPVLLSLALLVTSVLLGVVNLTNLLSAAILFLIIGFSIFLAELVIGRLSRGTERQETYTLISNLLLRNRANEIAHVLSEDEVFAIETAADEVWIYAYNLAWEGEDSVFPGIVSNNLKRGVKYRYIVPNNKEVHLRVNTLRNKHSSVKNASRLVRFRSRMRDLKLVQFGITIYNPSILDPGAKTDCIVVFFPHYDFYGPKNRNEAPFITIKGQSTVEIQEGFLELWNESVEVPIVGGNAL